MTEQITVPKQTWNALVKALVRLKIEVVLSDIPLAYVESHFREHLDIAENALTAANAVSAEPILSPDAARAMVAEMDMNDRVLAAIDAEPQATYAHEGCGSLGIPLSCGKPLCSPKQHHPLCKEYVQPQAQGEAITLQRWGRAENLCLRLLDPMEDGYWTPWHIAQEAIDSLQKNIAHPQVTEPQAQGEVVSKAQFNRVQDDYKDLLAKSKRDALDGEQWRKHVTRCQNEQVDTDYIFPEQSRHPQATEPQEAIAWEATTPGYIKYVTDKQYRSYSETAKRWYKPYKCSSCQAQATEPAGYKLVPVEPTHAMLLALINEWTSVGGLTMCENYRAMLAAAPAPKEQDK